MNTRDADIITVDPEDAAAARAWAARRAAAQQALNAAKAELAQLNSSLSQPPASTALGRLAAAQAATAQAQTTAGNAATQATTDLQTAARFAANVLATDQAAADTATLTLATALAGLLREASTTSALTATVDGLALRQRYATGSATPNRWDHTTLPFLAHPGDAPLDPELMLPAVNTDDYHALLTVLDQLDAGVDAVADLVTAESVHQLVQGNLVRSGSALDVATSGAVPDQFEVIRTPQAGEAVTHRVLLLTDPDRARHWPAASGPAALADPLLASWVTYLLPDPAQVGVTVSHRDPDGEVGHPVPVTIDQLGLDPLDLVRAAADAGELAQRIALVARTRWVKDLGEAAMTGTTEVTDGGTAVSLRDLIAAAESVRGVLGRIRAANPDDLSAPTVTVPVVPDHTVAQLTERVASVESALQATVGDLGAATVWPGLARALIAAASWAVPGAVPQLDQGVPPATQLQAQAKQAAAELTKRMTVAPFEPVAGDPELTVRRARERLAALLGRPLPVLVPVVPPAGPVWDAVTGGTHLGGADPATLRRWLDAYAQVRPTLAAMVQVYDLAETLGSGGVLDLAATQILPTGLGTIWLGADPQPPAGLTSIVVQRDFDGAPGSVTGLVVDGWTQRVPGTEQHAAVTFHFDQPDSTPPQVALVAVAPDLTAARGPSSWDLETLIDVLTSTMALARQRAVAAENATVRGITVKGG